MSLPRRERRALRRIEAGIRRSDPGLAQLLGDFDGLAAGQPMSSDQRSRGAMTRVGAFAAAGAVSAARLVARGTLAVFAPGVRERLGVRELPQPMGRSPWQRLT